MAVTVQQSLANDDMAYGPNLITLSGIGSADKFAIRVKKQGTSDILATIGQAPNAEGRAIFDLQKIFQSYVRVGKPEVEALGGTPGNPNTLLATADPETYMFAVEVGTITGNTFTADSTLGNRLRFNGVKAYHDLQFDISRFQGDINADDSAFGCTEVSTPGLAFTRWPETPLADVPGGAGGRPPNLGNLLEVYQRKATMDESMTITWLSELDRNNPQPTANAKGIEAFEIAQYTAANTLISRTYLTNTQNNGGGPNLALDDGDNIVWPYHAITMGVGPDNLEGATYFNLSGTPGTFNFNANCAYYWVVPRALTPFQCSSEELSEATHNPVRVEIVDPACLDYDLVQFSWLNAYGFRDYYTFKARNEFRLNMQRNQYHQEWVDYNGLEGGYGSGAGAGIGYGGANIYNVLGQLGMSARTDFVDDATAKYLSGLFKSANVRVRFVSNEDWIQDDYDANRKWQPCILKSNSYVERNYRKDRLFQYEVQFEMAHPQNIQHG